MDGCRQSAKQEHTNIYTNGTHLAVSGDLPYFPNDPCRMNLLTILAIRHDIFYYLHHFKFKTCAIIFILFSNYMLRLNTNSMFLGKLDYSKYYTDSIGWSSHTTVVSNAALEN